MRNRIISALSSAVLVVEAGEISGALITARYALLQGKPLFAVPGDITSPRSVGTNRLIADGAIAALDASEMLEHFRFLYRDAIRIERLPEAMQYSAITAEALRRFGLRLTEDAKEKENVPEHREKRIRRKKEKEIAEQQNPITVQEKPLPDTSPLTPRQKELYDMLGDGSFSVDHLTARGVPVSEAASTLTVFEIYGLVRSLPGGVFSKR